MMNEAPLSPREIRTVTECLPELWPWEAQRYKLWSLFDMVTFPIFTILTAAGQVYRILAKLLVIDIRDQDIDSKSLNDLTEWVSYLNDACETIPLNTSVKHQIKGLVRLIEPEEFSFQYFYPVCINTMDALHLELTSHYFLMIPAEDRALYDQKVPIFGDLVDSAFPSLGGEIASAGRCQALGEHTACVFHLMRCLELCLPVFGKHVGLDPDRLTMGSWKNLVEMIDKKIRAAEQTGPKTPEKDRHLQVLSEAAGQFHHFRLAWRNQVAHRRVVYGHREATIIMNGVRAFMQHLAAHGIAEDDEEDP